MKTITTIVYNFVRKQLAKRNMGQGKGITSLPGAADIEIGMTDVYDNLRKGGLDAVSASKAIKSEDDLARTLAEINALDRDKKLMKDYQQSLNQDPNRLDIIMDKLEKGIPLNPSDQYDKSGGVLDAFQGFKPKVIQGGKSEKELLEKMNKQNKEGIERIKKRKETDPDKKAEGGRTGYFKGGKALLEFLQSKLGKKAITTADKIDRPESALNREMFGEFNERMNRQILDVPPMPGGFKLSKEKLLKNYPEIDESFADEIMAMDKELQGRVIKMIKDRRKDPKAYDKLLKEKGDTLDFQGEFDRSVQRSKNAEGGLMRLGFEKGSPPSKGRRNFLKLMGGLAALPVVGKFFKPVAKVADKAVPVVQEGAKLGYENFMLLVDKIKRLGKPADNLATQERQRVIRYDGQNGNEYELVEDLTTGDISVTKDKSGFISTADDTIETIENRSTFIYKKGEDIVDTKTGKSKRTPDEYEEVTQTSSGPEDAFDDVTEIDDRAVNEVVNELKDVAPMDDLTLNQYLGPKSPRGKKAGGGLAYMLGE
jgi:hypothetical protein